MCVCINNVETVFKAEIKCYNAQTINSLISLSQGFCRLYSTVKDGERFSTAKDFLRPVMSRKNLHVSTFAVAIKVRYSMTK